MDPQFFATDPLALATIEGARITAEATARSAWVQAGAALGAIVAGALAYFGAVRQVRLQERAHEFAPSPIASGSARSLKSIWLRWRRPSALRNSSFRTSKPIAARWG
jgi:hypothetical protein